VIKLWIIRGQQHETSIREKRLLSCLNTDIVGIGGRLLNAAGSIIVSTAGATVNRC